MTSLPSTTLAWIALVAIGAALLARGRRAVAQTTLQAAWCWALASWVAVAAASLATLLSGDIEQGDWRQSLQLAAAMTTVCPAMAMLGAKRPQHLAWQWIVLSLWVVLSLPAVEWQLFSSLPNIHPARRWFLLGLILPGVVNYLPTRHALAALTFGVGQICLFAPYLPGGTLRQSDHSLLALTLFVVALAVAQRPRRQLPDQAPLDRLWRDFCNLYGLVWGLRVAERFNASAAGGGWPVRLNWRGLHPAEGTGQVQLSPPDEQAVADNLSGWLRRFVEPDWIARRLGRAAAAPETAAENP